jgi:hypothetical protein
MEMPGITISSKHQGKYLGTSGQTFIGASVLSDVNISKKLRNEKWRIANHAGSEITY